MTKNNLSVDKKIPCLILARGGSKGLPGKNIKQLLGKPLLGWVIESAKMTNYIGEIYVSTDCSLIKEVALFFGAKVIDRPDFLAADTSLDIDAFEHAIDFMDDFEEIVHLRATTPIIDKDILDEAISYYFDNKNRCTSMRSGHRMSESLFKYFRLDDIYFEGIFGTDEHTKNRQETPKTFIPNGYIDIVKLDIIKSDRTLHGDKILAFITEPVIEIDTPEDFEYLEYKMKKINEPL
jgi:CMP-N-acetylneuraminic acid synthetase